MLKLFLNSMANAEHTYALRHGYKSYSIETAKSLRLAESKVTTRMQQKSIEITPFLDQKPSESKIDSIADKDKK